MSNIVIYGKENCQYCVMAKKACAMRGKQYEYKHLGQDYTLDELKALVPAVRTFPAVFVDGTWIGGFDDLMKVIR